MISNKSVQTPGFRSVPRTGVIYVMHEAIKHGYSPEKKEWADTGISLTKNDILELI